MYPNQPTTMGLARALSRLGLPGPSLPSLSQLMPVLVVGDVSATVASEVIEARAVISHTAAGVGGQRQYLELHAMSPGGVVVEYLWAATTLLGGTDALPFVVAVHDDAPVGGTLVDHVDLGGVPTLSQASYGQRVAALPGSQFALKCSRRETESFPGPDNRWWGEFHSRWYIDPGWVLQLYTEVGQYLEAIVIYRELQDSVGNP
jgi:hypothetical protein